MTVENGGKSFSVFSFFAAIDGEGIHGQFPEAAYQAASKKSAAWAYRSESKYSDVIEYSDTQGYGLLSEMYSE